MIWTVAFAATIVGRAAVRFVWQRTTPPERGLIVGTGATADAVFRKLTLEAGHHFEAVRRLDVAGDGVRDALEHVLETERIERVVLALPALDDALVSQVASVCRSAGSRLSVVSPFQTLTSPSVHYSQVAELPILDFDNRLRELQ